MNFNERAPDNMADERKLQRNSVSILLRAIRSEAADGLATRLVYLRVLPL